MFLHSHVISTPVGANCSLLANMNESSDITDFYASNMYICR